MTARTVRIRRADGTLRLVEYSRSGRVKSDQPACESCQGTGTASIVPSDSVTYLVTILEPGNVTSKPDNVHVILTSTDHIAPPDRVQVVRYCPDGPTA